MKLQRIDLPPLWLLGFAALAWMQARFLPLGLSLDGPFTDLLSGLLIGAGLLLMVLAVTEMRRHKTTLWPLENAQSLVQTGIFKRTRNPIYLGDVLILAGLILRFDAVLALPLVPIFVWVLERRFVIPEENRLRQTFRADFARYQGNTRRWV